MSIRIHTKNIDLNPESERYIHKKFNRIQRRLPNLGDGKLEVSRVRDRATSDRFKARMTLKVAGRTLRGQRGGVNLYAAVDNVADVVDSQIRRFKGKSYHAAQTRKARRAARNIPAEVAFEMPELG